MGFVKSIITDQGKEFNNSLLSSLFSLTNTQHKVSSAYHPQTNGLVERFNQTLINCLQKAMPPGDELDWDLKIDAVLFVRSEPNY